MDYTFSSYLIEPENLTPLAMKRRALGYSQAMLSQITGINLRTLQQYESRSRDISKASVQTVMLLARALECRVEDIIDVDIDAVTDCIVERTTHIAYDTCYMLVNRRISPAEAKNNMRRGWKFDWHQIQEEGYDIIELYTPHDNRTQGRISFSKRDGYYYVDHVENAPCNVGHEGKYEGVGANLFAVVCRLSKDNGFDGFVSFFSKKDDVLIENYIEKLHAKRIGNSQLMVIDSAAADYLINKYQL